jgi:hypothetical protein
MEKKIVINGKTYIESNTSTFNAIFLIEEFVKKFVEEGKITEEKPAKK